MKVFTPGNEILIFFKKKIFYVRFAHATRRASLFFLGLTPLLIGKALFRVDLLIEFLNVI